MDIDLKYRIKEFKVKQSLTYQDIANTCRKDRHTVYIWSKIEAESNICIPSDALRLMSKLFGCSMEELHTESISVAV